jgi:hypothetical protein
MSAVPITSRGTPLSTYTTASACQRRSPWRMPAWPPMIVNGIETTETSAAVARLSSRSTASSSGVRSSRSTPSAIAAR